MSKNILFIGVDLHKEFCQIAVIGSDGSITQKRVPTEREALRSFLGSLQGEKRLVVEACGNWYYFYQCAHDLVTDFALANPYQVKAVAWTRIKTDKIDAAKLAYLLRADLIPRCYIPTMKETHQRELLRHRSFLVAVRTQMKNRLHSTLAKNGLKPPVDYLWGKHGRQWLASVKVPAVFRFEIDAMIHAIEEQDSLIKAAEEIIKRQVEMTEEALILKKIHGIGDILALTIAAEVGDITRFPSPEQLSSYAGLVPSTYSSGSKTINGRITKQGSRYLRWALIEASLHAWKTDEQLGRIRERIKKRKGVKLARVAVARMLAKIIWHKLMRARRERAKLKRA